jgi:hypothetical protein
MIKKSFLDLQKDKRMKKLETRCFEKQKKAIGMKFLFTKNFKGVTRGIFFASCPR